jgi:hypothetical protein
MRSRTSQDKKCDRKKGNSIHAKKKEIAKKDV